MSRYDVSYNLVQKILKFFVHKPPQPGERRLWLVIAVTLTLAYLLPIWLMEFPPLQDYPYHLLRIHILANYTNPDFNYNTMFTVSLFPLPYILFDYLMLQCALLFTIPIAGKIVLSVYVVLFVWSVFYFVGAIGQDNTLVGFFGFLLIYNWYFNKGMTNFVLGIPLFLFAVGYYWRYREALTWPRWLVLCGLILGTYLAHLYAFGFLIYALILLALLTRRGVRPLVAVVLAFLPTLALLGVAITVHLPTYTSSMGLTVFEYPTLRRTMELAIHPDLPYFTSFVPSRERWIFLAAAGLALILSLANARALLRNSFTTLVVAFCVLYLVLPEYVSPDYNYFACRVLIFIALLALALLGVPRTPLLRTLVLGTLVTMALGSLALTARVYIVADQGLRDYYAALERIPAKQAIWFAQDRSLAYIGRITPFAYFHGYYYLRNAGGGPIDEPPESFIRNQQYVASGAGAVPSDLLGGFIGPLRSVQFRQPNDDGIDNTAQIEASFARREINIGGIAIVLSGERHGKVQAIAERYGFVPVLDLAGVMIYQRREHPAPPELRDELEPLYRTKDYLLIYQDRAKIPPLFRRDFDLVFSQGNAHLFKRRVS